MVTVRSDEERVQSIINFFKDYQLYIFSVIFVIAISVGGYLFSNNLKTNQIQAAKIIYEDWQIASSQEESDELF